MFSTTDPEKVLPTILSRCQRFDFGTVATASIIERLRQIAETEGFAVEPAALALVARRAAVHDTFWFNVLAEAVDANASMTEADNSRRRLP